MFLRKPFLSGIWASFCELLLIFLLGHLPVLESHLLKWIGKGKWKENWPPLKKWDEKKMVKEQKGKYIFCLQRKWAKEFMWMGFVLTSSNNYKDAIWKLFSTNLPGLIVSKQISQKFFCMLCMSTAAWQQGIANYSSQGSCDQVHSRT